MTHAALVIQNGYRSYCANKRFKKSQNQGLLNNSDEHDTSSQFKTYYKNYQSEQQNQNSNSPGASSSKEPSPSGPLK